MKTQIIHYPNNIIIDVIDSQNARAIVPQKYVTNCLKLPRETRINHSPLNWIIKQLQKDFEFNTKHLPYTYKIIKEDEKIIYHFHIK